MNEEIHVEVMRDGLRLRGRIVRAEGKKNPAVIIFHGFGGDSGYGEGDLYSMIAAKAVSVGVNAVRFDFDGYGKSEGRFEDMDLLREILDAVAILRYVRNLPYVDDIYLLGHSMGGVVAGILAGLYPDLVKKLALLAPAATLKDDALMGRCMGTEYDTEHIPEVVLVGGQYPVGGHFFRIAKNLPIYEITSQYQGETLLIHGTGDMLVDYHASVAYHDRMRGSELCLYGNLDHGMEGEDKPAVLEQIAKFFGGGIADGQTDDATLMHI